MQIAKSFLVVCAMAYCAALLPLRGADTEAQIKAREALEKKLNELQTQPPAATKRPSVASPQPRTQPAPAAVPAPATVPAPAPEPAKATLPAPAAADSETTAKAREALRQKMSELQAQPGQAAPQPIVTAPAPQPVVTTPAPRKQAPSPTTTVPAWRSVPPAQWTPSPVPAPRSSAPVAQPVPAPVPSPVTPEPTPPALPAAQPAAKPVLAAPPPVDPESIARAREALRQKMAEMQGQPAQPVPQPVVAAPPPPKTAVTAPAVAPPPVTTPVTPPVAPPPVVQPVQPAPQPVPVAPPAVQPTTGPVLAVPTPSQPEDIAKARAAMEAKLKDLAALPPSQTGVASPAPAPGQKPSRKPTAARALQPFPPIQGPPPAVSATKQQRLDELLLKYRTDQITPEQYHEQRAKILAEP